MTVLTALLIALTAATPAVAADSVVYLVRHAEKVTTGDDPALSATGRERARVLAKVLADAGIEAIHSTDFRRTRDTVAPLAARLGLPLRLYDPGQPDALVGALLRAGGRHLVVGHSNTVPDLVARLGGDGGTPIDEAAEYDRLYVVTITSGQAPRTELRRYGRRFSP